MTFNQIINTNKPVLIDFYANWCQPCKMVSPILKQVKDNLGEDIKIVKINVDKNPSISAKYSIRSIPTLILFKNGNIEWNKVGVASASEIIKKVKETI